MAEKGKAKNLHLKMASDVYTIGPEAKRKLQRKGLLSNKVGSKISKYNSALAEHVEGLRSNEVQRKVKSYHNILDKVLNPEKTKPVKKAVFGTEFIGKAPRAPSRALVSPEMMEQIEDFLERNGDIDGLLKKFYQVQDILIERDIEKFATKVQEYDIRLSKISGLSLDAGKRERKILQTIQNFLDETEVFLINAEPYVQAQYRAALGNLPERLLHEQVVVQSLRNDIKLVRPERAKKMREASNSKAMVRQKELAKHPDAELTPNERRQKRRKELAEQKRAEKVEKATVRALRHAEHVVAATTKMQKKQGDENGNQH